jgi:PAS domain-containing protein
MGAIDSLLLDRSWPLWEQGRHFDLGCVLNSAITDAIAPSNIGDLGLHHAGCFECDLSNDALTWSGGVYDIFGLPRGCEISRQQSVSFYSEDSRTKMERLRAHAITHKRGFTLDVEIRAAVGETRWMRLIAAPVLFSGRATHLHGLKLII